MLHRSAIACAATVLLSSSRPASSLSSDQCPSPPPSAPLPPPSPPPSSSSMPAAAAASALKTVREVCRKPPRHWVGDGFHVYPVFADRAFTSELSPFLMFDYASPKEFGPTSRRRGVGSHPHRGFETVTLAFQGEVEHGDSRGNRGVIGPGDVQWMTAGRGIVHEEFHSDKFTAKGGVFEMCQLWLNLPAKHKMDPPRYQPILASQIPSVPLGDGDNSEDGFVRVIAGEFKGVKGPAKTFTPVSLWNIEIAALNKPFDLELGDGHNCVVFVRSGRASVGGAGLGFGV